METEDTAVIAVKYKSGILGSITATCSSQANWRHVISISGTEGYLEYLNLDALHMEFKDEARHQQVVDRLAQCRIDEAVQKDKGYYGGGHPGQIRDFVEAIREGRQPFVTARSAAETVKMVFACYESNRTGQWVKLD